jgi:large subunit ribosomal protein L19
MSQENIRKFSQQELIRSVEQEQIRGDLPEIHTGDTLRMQVKVVEGNHERLQPFEGVVIRLRGTGINKNITVRHIFQGIGVERMFLLSSPRIESIQVLRHARVRRKQLYYLRVLTGKAARLKEVRLTATEVAANNPKKKVVVPHTSINVSIENADEAKKAETQTTPEAVAVGE